MYRALKHRRPEPAALAEQAPDPRAAELRARLAEAQDGDAEPAGDDDARWVAGDSEPLDPEARRRLVHEQGRAALDEMHSGE